MAELVPSLLVLVVCVPIAVAAVRRLPLAVRGVAALGVVMHLAGAAAMVGITRYYYGYGDMLNYHRVGVRYAERLRDDFAFWAPDLARLVLLQPNDLPDILGNGRATGAMFGISTWLNFFLADSLWAICFLLGVVALCGKLALVGGLVRATPAVYHRRIAMAVLLVPSLVFWSCGLLKESIAVTGLCFLAWAYLVAVLAPARRGGVAPATAALVGGLAVALVKPYILVPFAVAAGAGWAWRRQLASRAGAAALKPLRVGLAALGVLAVVAALGAAFPRYSTDNVLEETARLRAVGAARAGGSTFDVGGPIGGGVAAHLAYAPVAVASALFRPFIFEVRNPLMLVSAIEIGALLLFLVAGLRRGARRALRLLWAQPILIFAAAFVIVFALAVGLSTTNMGTLSRYRIPLLPFYGLLIVALLPERTPLRRPRLVRAGPPLRPAVEGAP